MRNVPFLLHDFLRNSASRFPLKTAVVCRGHRLTYADIDARSNALARGLRASGVMRGDRVLIFIENSPEYILSFWAILKADAVAVLVNPLTKTAKLEHLLNDCRAKALIAEQRLARVFVPALHNTPHLGALIVSGREGKVNQSLSFEHSFDCLIEEQRSDPPPSKSIDADLAAIIYTSGSTGEPKGVMLTHRNMVAAATSVLAYLQNDQDDVVSCVLPLSFNYGLYQMIMTFGVGATLVLEQSFAYPAQVLSRMEEERVTGFPGVPTMFATMAGLKSIARYDLSSIRYITNAGAALPVKHIRMLRELFPQARIYSMYGLTECKRCTYLPPEDIDRKPESVGIAIPNTELWIIDGEGKKLGPNQVGELVIRGATVMKGYWEKPAATAERLKPGPLPNEVVLHTGDYCKLDEEGYLYFVARMDDVFKSRGEKVAPKEVESVLTNVPGVKEAAVIGVPDAVLGHAVKAFVTLDPGVRLTAEELQFECQKRLESFMVPKRIEILDEFPKTATGKIKKSELR